jgi:hypothetical protein
MRWRISKTTTWNELRKTTYERLGLGVRALEFREEIRRCEEVLGLGVHEEWISIGKKEVRRNGRKEELTSSSDGKTPASTAEDARNAWSPMSFSSSK